MRIFDRMNFGETKVRGRDIVLAMADGWSLRRSSDMGARQVMSKSWANGSIISIGWNEDFARSIFRRRGGFFSHSWTMKRINSKISRGGRMGDEPRFMTIEEIEEKFPKTHADGTRQEALRLAALEFAITVYMNTEEEDTPDCYRRRHQEEAIRTIYCAYEDAMAGVIKEKP